MTDPSLLETLAEDEHKRWARWMEYLFSKCDWDDKSNASIPKSLVLRWSRLMNTEYKDLSEEEKESDRDEARRIMRILSDHGYQAMKKT